MITSHTATDEALDLIANAEKAFQKARINCMRPGATFISSVCFGLEHVFTDQVSTAGTDGVSVYYNPTFFLDLKPAERVGLILHETWHVALLHCQDQLHSRLGDREKKLWNIAADAVINLVVTDSGFTLPPDGVWMPEMRNLSTEAVYQKLLKLQEKQLPQFSDDQLDILEIGSGENDIEDTNDDEEKEGKIAKNFSRQKTQQEIKSLLIRANTIAKMSGEDIGNLPGELQLRIKTILNPTLPWQQLLQRYVSSRSKTNYSFTRPNRRYFPHVYLPSKTSLTVDHVTMAIDLSASISDEEVNKFVNEIAGVMHTLKPKQLDILEFDTQVRNVTRMRTKQDILDHAFTGRGGTSIYPVINYLNENSMNLMVIFTDGFFDQSFLMTKKSNNLLWVIYDNPHFSTKHGHVIHVNIQY